MRATLERLVQDNSAARKTRLHALWSLIGGDALSPELHAKLLANAEPAFRAWAVRAAGNAGTIAPEIRNAVVDLARDSSPDVQLQVAIASRKIDKLDALAVLNDVLTNCDHDKLIPAIVWANLHPLLETDSARFARTLKSANPLPPAVALLLPRAIDRILERPRAER